MKKSIINRVTRTYVEEEVYFDVTCDCKHPFVAYIENMDVKVLSTTINVRL